MIFVSGRLGFRLWNEDDRQLFRQINADQEVMRFYPSILTPEESDRFFERINAHHRQRGYGLWAVDYQSQGFIGYIGFNWTEFPADFTPCVEIGWRLNRHYWGMGLASEGAQACLEYGWNRLNFNEVFSFTSALNLRSERVMQKIGMKKTGEFNHPALSPEHPLSRHVLYKSSIKD
jgi:ribosomal-protein-alanine N-acetyltransferase